MTLTLGSDHKRKQFTTADPAGVDFIEQHILGFLFGVRRSW